MKRVFLIFPHNQILPTQINYVIIIIFTLTWGFTDHKHFHSLFLKINYSLLQGPTCRASQPPACFVPSSYFIRTRMVLGRIPSFRISDTHCLSLLFPSLIFLGPRIFLYPYPGEARKKSEAIYTLTEMHSHIRINYPWYFDTLFFYL